jgi:hypothetical protein
MIFKLTAIAGTLLLLAVGITAAFKFSQSSQEDSKDKSIASLARRTKSQGKTRVSAPGKIIDYPGMNIGLDEALKDYSVVIAEPIESKSFITDSLEEIRTAYKLRILETLSRRNAISCSSCPLINDVSDKVQPALHNEFILELSGGTVNVDGVEITMVSDGTLKIEEGQRYLMFISFTPGSMARVIGGPSGMFRITSDESLEAMGKGKHRLAVEIGTRFSKSLSKS